jgi:hypothetical protein
MIRNERGRVSARISKPQKATQTAVRDSEWSA